MRGTGHAPGRIRTCGLALRRRALYPLSYGRGETASANDRRIRLSRVLVADVSETYTDLVTTVFSSTIAAKAWFATAAVLLALVQVTTAARIYGKLSFPPRARAGGRPGPPLVGTDRLPLHAARLLPLRHDPRLPDAGHASRDPLPRRHVRLRRVRREGADRARPLAAALGPADGGAHAGLGARRTVGDVEPLVLHDGEVRLLMGRGWRPILIGGAVVVATFALAQAQSSHPSAPTGVGRGRRLLPRRDGLPARVRGLSRRRRQGWRRRACAVRDRPRRDRGGRRRPAGPRCHARRDRQRAGAGGRRRVRRRDLEPVRVGSSRAGRSQDRPVAARGDVRHRARGSGLRRRRPGLDRARGRHGPRGGSAGRALRRVGGVRAALRRRPRRARRRRPVRARGHRRAPRLDPGEQAAKSALDAALHDLQGKLLGIPVVPAPRAAADRPADLVDGLARRSGRHGAASREGGDVVSAAEAQARRR